MRPNVNPAELWIRAGVGAFATQPVTMAVTATPIAMTETIPCRARGRALMRRPPRRDLCGNSPSWWAARIGAHGAARKFVHAERVYSRGLDGRWAQNISALR